MFEQEIPIYRFGLEYLKKVVAHIEESDFTKPIARAINPPAYVLGHLAISNDFALQLLGQPTVCPAEWHAAFGPGSGPDKLKIDYPSKQELLETFELGHERVCEAVKTASPEAMRQPQSFPFFAGTPIRTIGDCVVLLMTSHIGLHTGQLSLMRRQLGHPPLF